MILLFLTKAEIVVARQNRSIRTISRVFPFPSVIRLIQYIKMPYKKIELSRKNILRRDDAQCQYCGTKKGTMTLDHIIPKSWGGTDTWDNLITACVKCNNKKGNRTPEEAKMPLRKKPRKPHYIIFLKQYLGSGENEWKQFLFMD